MYRRIRPKVVLTAVSDQQIQNLLLQGLPKKPGPEGFEIVERPPPSRAQSIRSHCRSQAISPRSGTFEVLARHRPVSRETAREQAKDTAIRSVLRVLKTLRCPCLPTPVFSGSRSDLGSPVSVL